MLKYRTYHAGMKLVRSQGRVMGQHQSRDFVQGHREKQWKPEVHSHTGRKLCGEERTEGARRKARGSKTTKLTKEGGRSRVTGTRRRSGSSHSERAWRSAEIKKSINTEISLKLGQRKNNFMLELSARDCICKTQAQKNNQNKATRTFEKQAAVLCAHGKIL